jgi:hypothetical protein
VALRDVRGRDVTDADRRRQIEVFEEFARFRPDIAFGTVGVCVHPPPDYDPAARRFRGEDKRRKLRAIDREIEAARPPPPPLPPPLPRVACPVCGMQFGCDAAVTCHRRRVRH